MSSITAAVVNVRMGSTRLPGKALRKVAGKPLLWHLLERLRLTRRLDRVVVATSTDRPNDAIAAFCTAGHVECFRGSEADVLGRTLGALRAAGATTGVVVFGDGPLIDPTIVDQAIEVFRDSDPRCDFVGNDLATTYPPGMEVEVFAVDALADADRRCNDPVIREHGTLYVRQNPDLYRLRNLEAPIHLRRPELELEVDTEADLLVLGAVLEHFSGRSDFTLSEIIRYLDGHPDVAALNRLVPRRWHAFRGDT